MGPIISARSVTDLTGMEVNDANLSGRIFNFSRFHDSLIEKVRTNDKEAKERPITNQSYSF